MKNYYVFSNVEDLLELPDLIFKANDAVWKFHIDNCCEELDFFENKWYLPINNKRKLTVVIFPQKLW